MSKKESQKRIGALDVVVLVLLLAVVCVGIFRFVKEKSVGKLEDFTVSIQVTDVSPEHSDYADDADYYLKSGEHFGKTESAPLFSPSFTYGENERGSYVKNYAGDGTVDFKAEVAASGVMTDSGFMLNGKTYLAPNMSVEITTGYVTYTATVTGIEAKQ